MHKCQQELRQQRAFQPAPARKRVALEPLVQALGIWGQRWVVSELSLLHLDAPLLMRRNLNHRPYAEATERHPVSIPGIAVPTPVVVANDRGRWQCRCVLDRPWHRRRSLRIDRCAR
jgi:hypothetical protein